MNTRIKSLEVITLPGEGSENEYGHFSHYHCRRPRVNPAAEVAVSSVAHSALPGPAGSHGRRWTCLHHSDASTLTMQLGRTLNTQ